MSGRISVFRLIIPVGIAFHRYTERLEEVQVVLGERAIFCRRFFIPSLFRTHFIQTDGRLQHEQHIKAVFPDILHNPGNLFALDDRLVNGLSQLLDEFAQTGCHVYLRRRPAQKGAGSGIGFIYLTSTAAMRQLR